MKQTMLDFPLKYEYLAEQKKNHYCKLGNFCALNFCACNFATMQAKRRKIINGVQLNITSHAHEVSRLHCYSFQLVSFFKSLRHGSSDGILCDTLL